MIHRLGQCPEAHHAKVNRSIPRFHRHVHDSAGIAAVIALCVFFCIEMDKHPTPPKLSMISGAAKHQVWDFQVLRAHICPAAANTEYWAADTWTQRISALISGYGLGAPLLLLLVFPIEFSTEAAS
jgi:hypothetical protein